MGQWQQKTWPICLHDPPEIVQIGVGAHGGPRVERYQLPDLWCLHLYRYEATVRIGEQVFPIRTGYASVIPADMQMEYRFIGRSPHLYAHFRLQRCAAGETQIPAMQDLGDAFGRIYEQLEQVAQSGGRRASARLWDVLWQIAERGVPEAAGLLAHPAVCQAVTLIERHLGEPLRVAALASETGVSDGYLRQLFQASFGMTVIGYIRRRRVERSSHLLKHSTLPVKAIAALVGLPDLHQFNKTIHQALGQSPRMVRFSHQSDGRAEPD